MNQESQKIPNAYSEYTHAVYWSRPIQGKNQKGKACRLLTKGERTVQIELEDGTTAIVDRRAIRAIKAQAILGVENA